MGKEVKLEAKKVKEEAKEKKLSYEELENVCHQLSEQSRTLYQKLKDSNLNNMFKRLDYLFAVLEQSELFREKHEDFLNNCIEEIIKAMIIPEEKPAEEEK